jgi:hypothetical protein
LTGAGATIAVPLAGALGGGGGVTTLGGFGARLVGAVATGVFAAVAFARRESIIGFPVFGTAVDVGAVAVFVTVGEVVTPGGVVIGCAGRETGRMRDSTPA